MASAKEYDELTISQIPAIELLKELGYEYIRPERAEKMRGSLYNVLLKDIIRERLEKINSYDYKGKKYSFSKKSLEQALKDLDKSLSGGLIKSNEKIYDDLLYGKSYPETLPDGARRSFSVNYIDWDNMENNVFHIVEEFSVEREDGSGNIRPDIVLFVNGIPFAVIECKKASLSIKQGISQTIRNQSKTFAPHLFRYVQIVMSTNKNGTKYATCGTAEKYWAVWEEQDKRWLDKELESHIRGRKATRQDKNIISLFSRERLLELTRYFMVYDKGVKKVARYQQYFALKEILKRVEERDEEGNRKGGVIWHTQGSGKSITMVMTANYLLNELHCKNPRVIVVTDRKNLDKQIKNTFIHSRLKAKKASSGSNLVKLLNDDNVAIITTLVHKFEGASALGKVIDSKDIFVLVDESHRTQYGLLHKKMRKVFPNACYLGFTGTPLMKDEKSTMIRFGELIHKYTITDGVNDKAIVPLIYEGRMIEQSVNQKAIDSRLDMITRKLNDKQKEAVKQKWSKFKRIASSIQRLELVAFDINNHFVDNYKEQGSRFKAMLATSSKIEAVRYAEAFKELGELNCAVVISPPDQREGYSEVDKESQDVIINYWKKMTANYKDGEEYEEYVKNEFIEGDELDLLIVVDKLLTGFDAPRATVLYIDKPMKEHTLLQAIARVNRLYEGKDYGYIMDYRGLLSKLDEAMDTYSGAGLEKFDPKDLKGTVYDVISIIATLKHHYAELKSIFREVDKGDTEAYEVHLEDEEIREQFYSELSQFGRHLKIAIEADVVYNALGEEAILNYKREFKFFQELRRAVKLRYSDDVDFKEYEIQMQKLMDNYIAAEEVLKITKPVDILDNKGFEEELERLQTPRAKADSIRTRLTKSINKRYDENPAFYKKFSQRIKEVLEAYKDKRITEAEYLQRMKDIKRDYSASDSDEFYPDNIKSYKHAQAFYGVIRESFSYDGEEIGNEYFGELAIEVDDIIKRYSKVDWHDNKSVQDKIAQEIEDYLYDSMANEGVKVAFDKLEKIIEELKKVALKRY